VPREQLERQDAERVKVCAVVDGRITDGLLGSHVRRRSNGHADAGEARAIDRPVERLGDAEIRDDRMALTEQDVLGFDVAVHDALRVRGGERVRHFAQDLHGFADRDRALPREAGAQRFARDVRHHVERPLARIAGRHHPRIEQRQDVRVLQARRQLDLRQEAVGAERLGDLGADDLDGDLARVPNVMREVDGRHAAFAELAFDVVPIRKAAAEHVVGLGHALTLRLWQ
jgi:hypothetical protein